jgi:predicted MarR family transcription regulator
MKISHKRKIQLKLQKRIKALAITTPCLQDLSKAEKEINASSIDTQGKVASKVIAQISLTPKQQQVFDIIHSNQDALNPKAIGLAAGQEEVKAAAWASGALKKLAEEGLVERIQIGNKVSYKIA